MSPFNIETCARPNILTLQPYRCARDDYKDDGTNVLLDANENAHGPSLDPDSTRVASVWQETSDVDLDLLRLNRYPDPHQRDLKQKLCDLRGPDVLTPENLFVGVGSDEAIDALLRCFCVPGRDSMLTCPPTYGMYSVSAQINDVSMVKVPLLPAPTFGLDVEAVMKALSSSSPSAVKLVYLCSPGNPTGSLLARDDIERILSHPTWNGVVVVDEAYIDFAPEASSAAPLAARYPNLVVMQTLSKAFGMAGIRVGAAFTSPPIASLLNNLKAPYNVSSPSSALAAAALAPAGLAVMRANRDRTTAQRDRLVRELRGIPGVGRLRGGTDSNFLLYEILNAAGEPDNGTALAVYEHLAERKGVVVRFRGKEHGCLGCLRITVGTEDEVSRFLDALRTVLVEVRGA
ncbi:histidinol-phosphate aminotransferase [Geosmithia morbida]|uniref:histidinol-phosphate transaminase n=1 Tax=Geosmithia morbida TaxID=1094350 RepID=A0A9P4Z3N5_9HYPO|nr:histidinol-phosphate aminotransferase [Geosmithia morbida]KAF4126849.1 histidinol-phosphate aminotransferase [Geosmithia morbida]